MPNDSAFVVMAKQPQVGKTKTRLSPPLSPGEAVALYEALLLDTLALLAGLVQVDLAIAITPPQSRPYFESIAPPGTLLLPVQGAAIGDCLAQALGKLLEMGYRKVLAINSDGPSLPLDYLQQALNLLEQTDIVLGLGHDGGYYLIGMKQLHLALFRGIPWSTEQVLARTLERAGGSGLRVGLTPTWYDVDTSTDLLRLQAEIDQISPDRLVHTRQILDRINPSHGGEVTFLR